MKITMNSDENHFSDKSAANRRPLEGLTRAERELFEDVMGRLEQTRPIPTSLDPARVNDIRARLSHHAISSSRQIPSSSRKTSSSSRKNVFYVLAGHRLSWAASIAGLFLLAGAWLYWPQTFNAPSNAPRSIELVDGSQVDLNASASITYRPRLIWWNREIALQGEAFFDVVSRKAPFRVKAGEARIEVLGTQFNVKVQPGDPSTAIYLFEGSIRLYAQQKPDQPITLRPGESAMISSSQGSIIHQPTTSHELLPKWRTHQPSFNDISLRDAFRQIETLYAIRISTTEGIDLDQKISYFVGKAVIAEHILADLCRVNGLGYRPILNGFEVISLPKDNDG